MTTIASSVYSDRYRHLIRQFPLRQLRTKADAEAATRILDHLFRDRYDDEGEAAYVYVLAGLLEDYEKRYDPTPDTACGLDITNGPNSSREESPPRTAWSRRF